MTWFFPSGTLASGDADVLVTPENAGWAYSGLHVYPLSTGSTVSVVLDGEEGVLVPLSAENVAVTVDGTEFTLAGRKGVFAAVSDWIYVPVGATVTMSGDAGEIALCTARATEVFPVQHVSCRRRAR
ncbi:MAG: hypothetical protein RL107_127 [Actinomycetota bacterium]